MVPKLGFLPLLGHAVVGPSDALNAIVASAPLFYACGSPSEGEIELIVLAGRAVNIVLATNEHIGGQGEVVSGQGEGEAEASEVLVGNRPLE